MELSGKTALVTGAGRGIGAAIAKKLADKGATVIINYSGNDKAAQDTLDDIAADGNKAEIYKCNVADYEEVEHMIQYVVQKYKKIDILINNAGITKDGLIMKMKEEDFDSVLNVNLKGTFNTIRHSARQMLKQRSGKIINISSMWGTIGASCEVAYSATKSGIHGLTRALAKELAPSNIQVNAIACGVIDTEMNGRLNEEERQDLMDEIPSGRFADPEEVAELALKLTDTPAYMTGQIIGIDGGFI